MLYYILYCFKMIYSIYKIVCEDANVKYSYVGSTRSFRVRKAQHKHCCNNEKDKEYNKKLYTTIRENGGWENWRIVVIAEVEVESKRQAEIIEEEHRLKLQANLNERRCHITEQEKKEYYKNNAEKLKEQHNEYYENNRDKIIEQVKEYQKTNADKITEWRKTKCNCKCGGKYTNINKSHHLNTKKHKKYLSKN